MEHKGLQLILPQLGQVNEQAGKRVTLTIVDDGLYRPELERIVAEHQLTDLVTFVGQKNKSELSPYYQTADIFVLPSKKEGIPNVVLEAMASGLPIVMTPCEGSEELIRGNGYAVPASEFGDRLISLGRDEKLRRQMGSASLPLVREQFRWSSIATEYLGLMKKILLERRWVIV